MRILVLALLGCGPDVPADSGAPRSTDTPVTPYPLLAEDLPAAVLSVWCAPDGQVWAVGTDDGDGPLVLHYDGAAWREVDTGTRGDLWWVWGDGDGALWMSGGGGRVLRVDGAGGFEELTIAPDGRHIFGIWGSSATDVWAVAADVSGATPGLILRYDGATWSVAAEVDAGSAGAWAQPFKVWGSGPDDVHVVGTRSLVMHWDGASWTTFDAVAAETTLFTVHGTGPDHAVAVGGIGGAVTARWDGSAWTETSPPPDAFAPAFTGVFAHPTHGTMAAGNGGAVWWDDGERWTRDERGGPIVWNYHGAFVEEDGGIWAVGGDLFNLAVGVVMYDGPREIPPIR